MSQQSLEFDCFAAAIAGARPYQEDAFRIWRPNASSANSRPLLVVLADGMGGHVSGEVASGLAASQYVKAFSSEKGSVGQRLDHSLHAGNDALLSAIRNDSRLAGMGCTLVASYVDQEGLRWASVGDSMLLLFRDNKLKRLNDNHSFGALLDKQAEANIISAEEAKNSPQRHTLRSALTGSAIPIMQVEARTYGLQAGDWLVIASDGLETLSGNTMAELIGRHADSSPKALVEALLKAVKDVGLANQDNTTVVAIRVRSHDEMTTRIVRRPAADAAAAASAATPVTAAGADGAAAETPAARAAPKNPKQALVVQIAIAVIMLGVAAATGFIISRILTPATTTGEADAAAAALSPDSAASEPRGAAAKDGANAPKQQPGGKPAEAANSGSQQAQQEAPQPKQVHPAEKPDSNAINPTHYGD